MSVFFVIWARDSLPFFHMPLTILGRALLSDHLHSRAGTGTGTGKGPNQLLCHIKHLMLMFAFGIVQTRGRSRFRGDTMNSYWSTDFASNLARFLERDSDSCSVGRENNRPEPGTSP